MINYSEKSLQSSIHKMSVNCDWLSVPTLSITSPLYIYNPFWDEGLNRNIGTSGGEFETTRGRDRISCAR